MSKKDQVVEAVEVADEKNTEESFHFGPGALLKQAREQKGMSLEDVCDRLKLMPQMVHDIESDDYQSSTPSAFYRGYIHNYAEILDLSGEEFCENFARYYASKNPNQPQQAGFAKLSVEQPVNSGNWIMRIISGVIILAILYSIYYLFAEYKVLDKFKSEPSASEQTELAGGDELLFGESSAEILTIEPSLTEGPSTEADNASSGTLEFNTIDGSENLNADTSVSGSLNLDSIEANQTTTEAAINTNAAASENSLSFTFTDDCWVKVTDATGAVLAIGIKQKGRSFTLNGVAPYQLTIGNPGGVDVQFNGEFIDMSAYASDQTAKLTLGN